MTETRGSPSSRVSDRRAGNDVTREMGDVDHTHPVTDRPFGERFDPTTAVAADGGERGAEPDDPDRMADVDHETPDGDGADPVFERGTEGRDEDV